MRTIASVAIGVIVLGVLAGAGIYWYRSQHAETPQDITEIQIQGDPLGAIPEATGIDPELGALPGETARALDAPAGDVDPFGIPSLETGAMSGDLGAIEPETVATLPPRETRPSETSGTRPAAGTLTEPRIISADVATPTPPPATQVSTPTSGTAPTSGTTPASGTEPASGITPTSGTAPTSGATPPPVATTAPTSPQAPTPTPRPTPAPGNYNVRTIQPVPENKLTEVRKAMAALNVTLREQQTGQHAIQAQRLALGYFRAKSEADSWAASNLKPKGFTYFVYPVQNMYSIQLGVFAEQQNIERVQRSLHEKFPGWRLPLRTEPITLNRVAYTLSISNIHPNLADNIWRRLHQLGIQAEIHG